jgi:hypothetical protein
MASLFSMFSRMRVVCKPEDFKLKINKLFQTNGIAGFGDLN